MNIIIISLSLHYFNVLQNFSNLNPKISFKEYKNIYILKKMEHTLITVLILNIITIYIIIHI